MKWFRLLLVALPVFFGVCEASDPILFRSTDGQTVVSYHGIQWKSLPKGQMQYLFLRGVEAKFEKSSVTLSADHAIAYSSTHSGKTDLTTLTALKDVALVKLSKGGSGPEKSTLHCDRLDYVNGKVTSTAKCVGSVLLTHIDSKKRTTLTATGGSGLALIAGGVGAKDSQIERATLFSPVHIRLVEASKTGKPPTTASVDCSEMVYLPKKDSATLQLTGKIRMKSAQFGTFENLNKITMRLNGQHELEDASGSGGS